MGERMDLRLIMWIGLGLVVAGWVCLAIAYRNRLQPTPDSDGPGRWLRAESYNARGWRFQKAALGVIVALILLMIVGGLFAA